MTDTHVSPDAVIADALKPDYVPGIDEPWEIGGRREAEWAIAKVRAAHGEYADATAPARDAIEVLQARIDELSEFIASEGARRDHTVGFFTGHLTAWVRRLRRKDLDDGIAPDRATKSMRLAGGTVASRAGQDRVQVEDADALHRWMVREANQGADTGGIAERVIKVHQRELRAWITGTGHVPPGVTFTPATEDDRTWSVKLS